MHAMAGQHVSTDQIVERPQQSGAAADLVGQRRQAEIDSLASVALGLAVERLMLAILLEQHHGQEAWAGEATRKHVERRRRLADRLAVPASELLANVLHDLPLAGDHLQRLADILAEPGEPRRAAAAARRRARHHDPLARQMRWERLTGGLLACEGADLARRGGSLRGHGLVLGGSRLEVFQLELHLVEQARLALAHRPEHLTPHLLDGQSQMRDQRLGARGLRTCPRQLGVAGKKQTLQRFDIVGKRKRIICAHATMESQEQDLVSLSSRADSQCRNQPAACGRHVCCGIRQSMPSSR